MSPLKILLLLVLSTSFSYGQQRKTPIKFDNTLLNIQYMYSSDEMDFYAAKDIKHKPPKENMPIFAITTHRGVTEADSKSYIERLKNSDTQTGKRILNTTVQDTVIKGNRFYSMTINEVDDKTKHTQTNLYGFLFKDNNAIIFLGSDMGSHEYFNALMKTFHSMHL